MHGPHHQPANALTPNERRTVCVGKYDVLDTGAEHVTVSGNSGFEPLRLPRQLVAVLGYFDGRPTDEVLLAIAAAEGLEIEPALVSKLVDFRILVLVPGGTPASRGASSAER